jgi:hypothetical protein
VLPGIPEVLLLLLRPELLTPELLVLLELLVSPRPEPPDVPITPEVASVHESVFPMGQFRPMVVVVPVSSSPQASAASEPTAVMSTMARIE